MKKIYITFITLVLSTFMCSCTGSEDSSSEPAEMSSSASDIDSSYATVDNSSTAPDETLSSVSSEVSEVSSIPESEINNETVGCKAYMDTSSLHDGVNISDDEFIQKAEDFKEYALNNGIKLEKRPDNVPKGSYVSIQLDEENSIYIASADMTWAKVKGEYYEMGNEKVKEFYDYAHYYLLAIQ